MKKLTLSSTPIAPLLLSLPLVLCVAACSSPLVDDTSQTADNALTSNGVDIGEHWKPLVQCQGAHIDSFDPENYGHYQLVITNGTAAKYLGDALANGMKHDPFTSSMSPGSATRVMNANEIVWLMMGFNQFVAQPRQDFSASWAATSGDEIRVDTEKYTWEEQLGGGTYTKHTDMKVRIVRNGWREYHCDPGLSGDPPSCGSNGQGWDEWELANWIFRDCSSL